MSFVSRRTYARAPWTRLFFFAKKCAAEGFESSAKKPRALRCRPHRVARGRVADGRTRRSDPQSERSGRTRARAVAKREREDSMGLDHLPPNHWARQRAPGNYLIAGTLLGLAGATYMYTMHQVQKKDDVDLAIEARTSGKK